MNIDGIEICETISSHLRRFYEILKEYGLSAFFPDEAGVEDFESFKKWWKLNATYSLTGLDDGVPVGCGFLYHIKPGDRAFITIFKQKGYLNLDAIVKILKEAINIFYDKFDLKIIYGFVRTDNEACMMLLKSVGFKIIKTERGRNKVKGRPQDYYLASMTKEALDNG